jgi:hypothetical protein
MSQFAHTTELVEMLAYARPHNSRTESEFVYRFLHCLPGLGYDKFGNAMLRIGTAPVLWSSHTDTVHHQEGKQRVIVKGDLAMLAKGKRGDCLGADDAAGIWLMCEMVRARVPGMYVFHAGEEHGGLGSGWLAKNRADLLSGIKYAIALDRKGTDSVITHQGERSCSDAFATALAAKLNASDPGFRFKPDDTGLFTDTANYVDLIGECTNLSVGYEGAHGPGETLDLAFITRLRDALVTFDCDGLPATRQPGEIDDDGPAFGAGRPSTIRAFKWSKPANDPTAIYDEALVEMCRDYPDVAAKLIDRLGGNADDMLEACWDEGYDI